MSLTHMQNNLFNFILQFTIKHNGVAPTFDQMKEALNLHSKSGVYRILTALEERGFIERLPNRARSIKIVDRTRYRELLGDVLADQLERAAKETNISPVTAIRECVRAYIGEGL